jgi:hypothetical protein
MRLVLGTRSGVAALAVALAVGALIRVAPGGESARAKTTSSAEIDATHEQALPAGGPQRAVVEFYRSVIRGRYSAAFALSVEPRWRPDTSGDPVVAGLQSRRAFVRALDDEIGPEGMRVGVARMTVGRPRGLGAATGVPALRALAEASPGARVRAAVAVHISGHLVGMCEISGFSHDAVAARVTGRWKVLLPGRRRANEPHFERWFIQPGQT